MKPSPTRRSPKTSPRRAAPVVVAVLAAAALGVWIGHEVTDDKIATVPVESHRIFVIDLSATQADGKRQLVSGQDDDDPTWTELGYPPRPSDEMDEIAGLGEDPEGDDEALGGDRVPVVGVDTEEGEARRINVAGGRGPDGGPDDEQGDGGIFDEPLLPDAGPTDVADQGQPEPNEPNATMVASSGESCGIVTCAPGKTCCNASCGICTSPGESCHQRTCGMPYGAVSVSCGSATCNVGDLCCNPSCGICVEPGETCDPEPCLNPVQNLGPSESCGMSTCNVGEVCCNPSCGICTKPGEGCSREICEY